MESYNSWKDRANTALNYKLGVFDDQIRGYLTKVNGLPDSTAEGSVPADLISAGKELLKALDTVRGGLEWNNDDVNAQLNTVEDMVDEFAKKIDECKLFDDDGKKHRNNKGDKDDEDDEDDEDDGRPPDVDAFYNALRSYTSGWERHNPKHWTSARSPLPLQMCGPRKQPQVVWPRGYRSFS